ncbi:MAG: ABC transporter permease [Turicibacter sp.]|nr:ABC transporter permease [Turicibacter sp.]
MEASKSAKKYNGASVVDSLYKYGTIGTIVLLVVFFSFASPHFLQVANLLNILRAISIVTIIAIGITLSQTVAGLDLSVGSVVTLTNSLTISMFVWHSQPIWVAILVGIGAALLVGAFNALMIVRFKIPDMILTLASMFIVQGVAQTYARGATISQNMVMPDGSFAEGMVPEGFRYLGQLPWIIVIMAVAVITVHVFLKYTVHGRFMYMIGGNPEAARLSGIPVVKYRVLAYLLSAAFAAIGGIVLASRVQTAQINSGAPFLMDAVAASYIGLSVLGAGKPNAFGTFIGAVLIGVLSNGLVMVSVPFFAMDIVKGVVLALALCLTYFRKK